MRVRALHKLRGEWRAAAWHAACRARGERHHPAAGRSGRTRLRRRGGPV